MSSSTSSFKTELKVIATVLVVIAIWEITARGFASVLDYDRKHIYKFPSIIKELSEKKSSKVVFLGNSLSLWGIDEEKVREGLKKEGIAVATAKIVPVGTAIVDWIYLYHRYFSDVGCNPDFVVMGFVAHHVPDVEQIKIPRLSRHFLNARNIARLFRRDISDFDDRCKVLLCMASAGFGDQPEHKYRLMDPIIADFRDGTRRVTHLMEDSQEEKVAGRPKTYERLCRMAMLLRDNHVHGVFVAMPLPNVWNLDPKIAKTVESCDMTFIDARKIEGLTADDYSDGYHLGKTGADKYSRFLAKKLATVMRQAGNKGKR